MTEISGVIATPNAELFADRSKHSDMTKYLSQLFGIPPTAITEANQPKKSTLKGLADKARSLVDTLRPHSEIIKGLDIEQIDKFVKDLKPKDRQLFFTSIFDTYHNLDKAFTTTGLSEAEGIRLRKARDEKLNYAEKSIDKLYKKLSPNSQNEMNIAYAVFRLENKISKNPLHQTFYNELQGSMTSILEQYKPGTGELVSVANNIIEYLRPERNSGDVYLKDRFERGLANHKPYVDIITQQAKRLKEKENGDYLPKHIDNLINQSADGELIGQLAGALFELDNKSEKQLPFSFIKRISNGYSHENQRAISKFYEQITKHSEILATKDFTIPFSEKGTEATLVNPLRWFEAIKKELNNPENKPGKTLYLRKLLLKSVKGYLNECDALSSVKTTEANIFSIIQYILNEENPLQGDIRQDTISELLKHKSATDTAFPSIQTALLDDRLNRDFVYSTVFSETNAKIPGFAEVKKAYVEKMKAGSLEWLLTSHPQVIEYITENSPTTLWTILDNLSKTSYSLDEFFKRVFVHDTYRINPQNLLLKFVDTIQREKIFEDKNKYLDILKNNFATLYPIFHSTARFNLYPYATYARDHTEFPPEARRAVIEMMQAIDPNDQDTQSIKLLE